MTLSSLQRQFVVAQPTKPSAPFDGQIWVDTSSGNATLQYKNGKFVELQIEPDNFTISKTASGQLARVENKETTVLGDFENGLGSWSYYKNGTSNASPTNERRSTKANRGSTSVYFNYTGNANQPYETEVGLKRSFSLPEKKNVSFDIYVDSSSNGGAQTPYLEVYDGSNQLIFDEIGNNVVPSFDTWTTVTVSSLASGSHTLKIYLRCYGDLESAEYYLDNIRYKDLTVNYNGTVDSTKFDGAGN